MCGRYGFIPEDNFYDRFEIQNRLERLETHYNVVPGMMMPVITRNSPKKVENMKWGLIPFWAKDPKIGYKMINARAEGISQKPAFKKPIRSQRCLIPTSGFFEWKRLDQEKIPYYIRLKDKKTFVFAGLYDVWVNAEGYSLKSFTIITTVPNKLVVSIHDRMPVILDDGFAEIWLDNRITDINILLDLLKPFEEDKMESFPVSKLINNPANDNSEVIKPIKIEKTSQSSFLL